MSETPAARIVEFPIYISYGEEEEWMLDDEYMVSDDKTAIQRCGGGGGPFPFEDKCLDSFRKALRRLTFEELEMMDGPFDDQWRIVVRVVKFSTKENHDG